MSLSRSVPPSMIARVDEEPSPKGPQCFLCRSESTAHHQSDFDNSTGEIEQGVIRKDFVRRAWKNATLESFCTALDLPMDLAKMLRNEDFCSECTLELQDLDWAVRTIQRLQHQIDMTKRKIEENLKGQAEFLSENSLEDHLGRGGHNMTMLLKCLGICENQVEDTQIRSLNEPLLELDPRGVVTVLKEEPMEIEEFHQAELNSDSFTMDDIPETDHHEANENFVESVKLEREDCGVGSGSVVSEDFDHDSKESVESDTDEELAEDLDYEPEPDTKAPSNAADIEDKKRILKIIVEHPNWSLKSIQSRIRGGRMYKHANYKARWERQIKEYDDWLESNKTRCGRCEKGFLIKGKFITHLKGGKCCYGQKNWTAMPSICLKGFETDEENLSHQSQHDPVHPLVCTDCGETRTSSEDLKEHMRGHQRDPGSFCKTCLRHYPNQIFKTHNCKPFVKKIICELCGKPFKNSSNLAKHKLSHSDDRTYLCDLCPSTFKFDYGLYLHKKTVHGIINQSKRSQSQPQTAISSSLQFS